MAQYAAMFGGYGGRGDGRDRGNNPIALLATIILAPMAAMLIQMAISRSREFAADAGGAQIAGNPYGLADALRKIDAVSKRCRSTPTRRRRTCSSSSRSAAPGLMSLFSSHPPTEARIRALLAAPRGRKPLSTLGERAPRSPRTSRHLAGSLPAARSAHSRSGQTINRDCSVRRPHDGWPRILL